MPRKIEKAEVCDRLLRWSVDNLDTSTFEDGGSTRITYRDFRTAMQTDDFIGSEPTIRSKWTMLAASGIISAPRTGKGAAVMYWDLLRISCTAEMVCAAERYLENEKKQKNKKTHSEAIA